ncbi:hemin uptake protein HemP [Pseudoxanthomonas sp. J35]|uniref:hemin uptake protein HemP n=1 Tax=Pseudoxanthomonas sp. J35 TaxID=935852 RepID=UPI00048D6524|nr:hemin uptake protein HemP [Pseudoxanthomonas sp. J35]
MNVHRLTLPHAEPAREAVPALQADDLVLDSDQLLRGRREILIRHGDRVYRLRHTSNDKLILTK